MNLLSLAIGRMILIVDAEKGVCYCRAKEYEMNNPYEATETENDTRENSQCNDESDDKKVDVLGSLFEVYYTLKVAIGPPIGVFVIGGIIYFMNPKPWVGIVVIIFLILGVIFGIFLARYLRKYGKGRGGMAGAMAPHATPDLDNETDGMNI